MSRGPAPFSPSAVLAMLVVGIGGFLLFLYAIGAGWDGSANRSGGAHGAANGLNGFAGLARLLEAQGHEVSISRRVPALREEGLVILTPQHSADGDELARIVSERRYVGPTLVILPKWITTEVPRRSRPEARPDWVAVLAAVPPAWLSDVEPLEHARATIGPSRQWRASNQAGPLPRPGQTLTLEGGQLVSLVTSDEGKVLAGYVDDEGFYPLLDDAAGVSRNDENAETTDVDRWPVVLVAEPDLLNNYGLADLERARLAHSLVDLALGDTDLPVVFDLTVAGLGRSDNLLTLAFTPPFLAATLCLLLAAIVVAWRAFRRFGAPVSEAPALAKGKRQLARNGAALVERARRLHLLGAPYAALVTARIAERLGVREPDAEVREAAVARLLAARGLADDYAERADALRRARHSAELLRAAGALRTIERTLAS